MLGNGDLASKLDDGPAAIAIREVAVITLLQPLNYCVATGGQPAGDL